MKIALIIGRIVLGGLFTFSAISFLFGLGEMPPMEGKALNFMSGLAGSGYFMVFLKVVGDEGLEPPTSSVEAGVYK